MHPPEILLLAVTGTILLFGLSGRTLHHYPSTSVFRRGTPRWWKDVLAGVTAMILTALASEFVFRPHILERARQRPSVPPEMVDLTITSALQLSYLMLAVILAWQLVATLLGPQSMTRLQRRHLMRKQDQILRMP